MHDAPNYRESLKVSIYLFCSCGLVVCRKFVNQVN
uniref:Uncharacterized protein n=1 Tax=Rhizophora mucronata TaxID=61149 RepID=A0A2P2IMU5_RHIMU